MLVITTKILLVCISINIVYDSQVLPGMYQCTRRAVAQHLALEAAEVVSALARCLTLLH